MIIRMGVIKHGHKANGVVTKTYMAWDSMLKRCNNPAEKSYIRYGGRGIKVCGRWHDFRNFLADMGEKPKGLSLDRIDNNGNYEPSNCRWATSHQQRRNTRRNVFLVFHGETLCIADWAKRLGTNTETIWKRYRSGWTVEEIVTTPVMTKGRQ